MKQPGFDALITHDLLNMAAMNSKKAVKIALQEALPNT